MLVLVVIVVVVDVDVVDVVVLFVPIGPAQRIRARRGCHIS